jgi:hypothetical protein
MKSKSSSWTWCVRKKLGEGRKRGAVAGFAGGRVAGPWRRSWRGWRHLGTASTPLLMGLAAAGSEQKPGSPSPGPPGPDKTELVMGDDLQQVGAGVGDAGAIHNQARSCRGRPPARCGAVCCKRKRLRCGSSPQAPTAGATPPRPPPARTPSSCSSAGACGAERGPAKRAAARQQARQGSCAERPRSRTMRRTAAAPSTSRQGRAARGRPSQHAAEHQ